MTPKLSYYSFDSLGNPWVSGGGAVRDAEVLRRFARHAEVTLYTARYPGFKDRDEHGVRIRGIGSGRANPNWWCRLAFACSANWRVLRDRSDIIGNSASIYAPVLTGLLTEFWRPRRFYAVYHHRVGARSVEKFGAAGWIPRLLEVLMLGLGKRYVISNATLAERVRRVNPKARVFTTFNGFDASLLSLPRSPAVAAPAGASSPTPPFVLFLGRFDVYMKGLDLLIPAWAETLAHRKYAGGIDLVLAGRGTDADRKKLEELIPVALRGKVRVESDVSEQRKRELLSGCLFFASPSRFEGFGIAALEANAAGVAVLATDTDGFRDSLALGETALAVPVEDRLALKAGLIRLATDATLREALGRAGRERARGFSWDAIAEKEWAWIASGIQAVLH
jgi:glycosyltransferase involved in cell wall biosynthesis